MSSETQVPGYNFSRLFTTRWNDNDVFGHINNTIHYAAMDTTITSWLLAEAGFGLAASEVQAVVVTSSCTYLESVSFPENLVVGLRAERLGISSVTWQLGLHRESDRGLVATGQFVHVFVGAESRRPVPIPTAVREAIEAKLVVR